MRLVFEAWCILAAPQIAGNGIGSMSPEITETLTNVHGARSGHKCPIQTELD